MCFVELYMEASLSEFEECQPLPDAAKRLDNYINREKDTIQILLQKMVVGFVILDGRPGGLLVLSEEAND